MHAAAGDGRRIAQALLERDERLRLVFEFIEDIVYLIETEPDYRFVAVNPALFRAARVPVADVEGRRVADVIPEPWLASVLNRFAEAQLTRRPVHWDVVAPLPGGTRYGEATVAPVADATGRCTHLLGTVRDVTAHRVAQQALERLARFDPLTELPNRAHFLDMLRQRAAWAERDGRMLALICLDLDGFKRVNDSLGHRVGDALLAQVATRLLARVRARDAVGRLGGDEFAVLAELRQYPEDAAMLAQSLGCALDAPFAVDEHEISVTASIGIAACPVDACGADDLVRFADAAMYHAKADGRGQYTFYSDDMNRWAQEHRATEQALRGALEHGEFLLHYQPQVDLRSGRVTGLEALLRWARPRYGVLAPGAFLGVLEETGLIHRVGAWVIDEACRQLAEWASRGLPVVPVAVNVSALQLMPSRARAAGEALRAAEFVDQATACLQRHGVEARLLELEVTESVLMTDPDHARELLSRLKRLGVCVHIDDFGTGYSSLAYLKRLPVDALKIDRTFVADLPRSAEDANLVHAVIGLAHSLGLGVIAEGVETDDQRRFLVDAGCDRAQGFLYARPAVADAVAGLLAPNGPAWNAPS